MYLHSTKGIDGLYWYLPCIIRSSGKLMDADFTAIRTSAGPRSNFGTSLMARLSMPSTADFDRCSQTTAFGMVQQVCAPFAWFSVALAYTRVMFHCIAIGMLNARSPWALPDTSSLAGPDTSSFLDS